MNETFRKKKKKEKSDYRIENTHRSLGQSKETRKTSCLQKHIMAHDIPKELPRTMKSFLKNNKNKKPIIQTVEAVREIVEDTTAKRG